MTEILCYVGPDLTSHHNERSGEPVVFEDLASRTDEGEVETHGGCRSHVWSNKLSPLLSSPQSDLFTFLTEADIVDISLTLQPDPENLR